MDTLNHKFGRETIKLATCGILKSQYSYESSQHRHDLTISQSPAYTVRWEDLPQVR
jgi:hypothetical protein